MQDYYKSSKYVYSFCCSRADKLAMLVHASSRIPLSERQVIELTDRMYKSATQAVSDADVTQRVNAVEDAFVSEIPFRTPRMWKFCRSVAVKLAFRLCVESKTKNGKLGLAWRLRTSRSLCRRMFSVACRASDEIDVNARIGNVYNAELVKHGIAPEV
jgi:hypothetical protein